MLSFLLILVLIAVVIYLYYRLKQEQTKPTFFSPTDPNQAQEVSEVVANLREENRELQTQLSQAQQLERFNAQHITRLEQQLETYSKGEDRRLSAFDKDDDWETKTGEIMASLEQEVKDLSAENETLEGEKDQAIRTKNEAQAEVLALNNKLKLKTQEVSKKEQALQQLKKEKSQSEISLNKTITELRTKYSKQSQLLDGEQLECKKLTEQVEKLEAQIEELKKHD